MDYAQAITEQVYIALERLGERDRPATKDAMTATLERAGAHPYLLAIIGSWMDTLEDAEVLEALKDWNAEAFKVELFASTGDVSRPRVRLKRV